MLTAEETLKVAKLASLRLEDGEVAVMAGKLSGVLDHINQLAKLDTSNVPPTSHILDMGDVFRNDETTRQFDSNLSLANAPSHTSGYFCVPRIIE
ncbi:MAG: Asp-tRNA(Asn)/Glu-tRNA(Gln) amidotransferase subunit GatC [Nitrospinae bacterium]|nr:Asp-tRNA(Asn)/Glu-tRNA(Gln) amidotransferase subunit GatC [Nitrospinota bacterium]